ncbi:MAG: hypothetical protein ABI411_05425 [Tahibacter sp.]
MTRRSFACFIAVLFMVAPLPSVACQCAAPHITPEQEIEQAYDQSESVAIMEVIGFERVLVPAMGKTRRTLVAVLDARYVFKGIVFPGKKFQATGSFRRGWGVHSDCDVSIAKGQLLVVYIPASGIIKLTACSLSGQLRFDTLPYLYKRAGRGPFAPRVGG